MIGNGIETKIGADARTCLVKARHQAELISRSLEFRKFEKGVFERFPWRRSLGPDVIERDYLRVVDHHLKHLIPQMRHYVQPDTRRVLDFGCGSGGSAIALALVYPEISCWGTDIDAEEISVARERAELYGVADRCKFFTVDRGEPLPFENGSFDYCQCSSVLEYVVDADIRRFCIREMIRAVALDGLLFFSVPNRVYPFEVHTRKWGWNYFPEKYKAGIVDSSFWEVRRLARPTELTLYRTPVVQLFKPWSNFCVRRKLNEA